MASYTGHCFISHGVRRSRHETSSISSPEQLTAGTVKEVPNGITFAGGVPIMRGGEFIGAVGTSGVRANEDEQISKAGANVIK
jgi:uncharacterized protein GlcG (DUF336 family)